MMILALMVIDDGNGDVVDIVGEGNCGNRDFKILTTDYEHAQTLWNTMDD